jgi:hypothetical protein
MRLVSIALLLALVAACAPATSTSTLSPLQVQRATAPGTTIDFSRFGGVSGETLFETLSRRSPMILKPRPGTTVFGPEAPLAVYIDGLYSGEVDVLALLFSRDVLTVQRLSPSESAIRFGSRHPSGVLVVTTTRSLRLPGK